MKKTASTPSSIKDDALALFQAGRLSEAQQKFEKICKQWPADADSWFFLGIIHGQSGDLARSEYCSRKAVQLAPQAYAAWDNLGISLMMQGKRKEAETCFMRALQSNPKDEQAHNNLGTLLRDRGEFDKALTHYRRAIELKPDYAEAYNNLGNMQHDRSQIREALASYEQALRIEPGYIDAHYNCGIAHQKMGHYKDALSSYQTVLRLSPGHVDAITGIANVHEKQSDYQKAYDILQPLINDGQATASSAITFSAAARRLGKQQEAIEAINSQLFRKDLSLELQQELHFNIGSLHDEMHDYAQAFRHFEKGNSLRPYPHDPTSLPEYFTEIISIYNADKLQKLARSSIESDRPVFIVGMPRSGTTLVEQILSSHPEVFGGGELRGIEDAISTLRRMVAPETPYPGFIPSLSTEALDVAAREFLDKLLELSPSATYVTDKMPHNFLHLGLIQMLFPKARIIHCTREPVDTCLSIYFHNFNANHPYTTNLASLGAYYKQYQRLMQHWHSSIDIPIHTVQYEELVANQENGTRSILDYCELAWDSACLSFHENKRVVTTPSYQQVRRPIYKSSVQRWKNYEAYIKPLIDALETNIG